MRKAVAIPVIFLFFLSFSCQHFDDLGERVTEGVSFEISTDLLANPLILQFGHQRTGEVPDGLAVSVVSSDFSGVYTLDGRLQLTFSDGVLPLAVRKDEIRPGDPPKRMVIRYEAPGFISQERVFVVNDPSPRLVQLTMQPGQQQEAVGDELVANFQLDAPTNRTLTSAQGLLQVTIPPQTRFVDQSGHFLKGSGQLTSSIFTNTPANRSFLRKQLTTQNFQLNDGSFSRMTIEPIALLTLSLSKRPDVSDLLYPITLRIPVSEGTRNRFTGAPLAVGDQVPVYGFAQAGKYWESAGLAEIVNGPAGLVAETRVKALQPLVLGWGSFQDKNIETECVLLVDIYAEVAEPYEGVYRRDHLDTLRTPSGTDSVVLMKEEVFFAYAKKPRLSFSAMFPNCATGDIQGLDGVIRKVKEDAKRYFLRQDSLAFKGVTFQTRVSVQPIFRPAACLDNTPDPGRDFVDLFIQSDAVGDGFLSYAYGNMEGFEYIRLKPGQNHVMLPYPRDLFLLDGEKATFHFTFLEGCYRLTDGTETDLCKVIDGYSFDISPPIRRQPLWITFLAETACNNVNNNKIVIRPTMPILFRPHCPQSPTPYRYLGRLVNGQFEGEAPLVMNQSYDFLLPLGTSITKLTNISLTTAEAIYQRDGNTVLVTHNEKGLVLDLGVVDIPDAICRMLN